LLNAASRVWSSFSSFAGAIVDEKRFEGGL
jgi:hypothetical protein